MIRFSTREANLGNKCISLIVNPAQGGQKAAPHCLRRRLVNHNPGHRTGDNRSPINRSFKTNARQTIPSAIPLSVRWLVQRATVTERQRMPARLIRLTGSGRKASSSSSSSSSGGRGICHPRQGQQRGEALAPRLSPR